MSKHAWTDGPWEVDPGFCVYINTVKTDSEGEKTWIANVGDNHTNARLIAAAPEMAEVIEYLFPLAVAWASYYEKAYELDAMHPTHREIIDRAKAVLAKVEGK